MKKTHLFLALTLALALLLSSCVESNGPVDGTTSGDTASEDTTDINGATGEMLTVIKDRVTEFEVIRPYTANIAVEQSADAFTKRIAKFTSSAMTTGTDWVRSEKDIPNDKPEILIGATNRQASIDLINALPENSYGIRVTDKQVVIAGSDETMLTMALSDFEERFLRSGDYADRKTGNLVLPIGTDIIVTDENPGDTKQLLTGSSELIGIVTNYLEIPSYNSTRGQGIATDGKYLYAVMMRSKDGAEIGHIVKIDMETMATVKVGPTIATDHGNDLCYNAKKNVLVLANMVGTKLSYIDPETLEITGTVSPTGFSGTTWCISYNAATDSYVFGNGGSFYITDAEFNTKSSFPCVVPYDYSAQGLNSDDDFIYIPYSRSSTSKVEDNVICVYKWDGTLVRQIHINSTDEIESMININGKFYANFLTPATTYLRVLKLVAIYD